MFFRLEQIYALPFQKSKKPGMIEYWVLVNLFSVSLQGSFGVQIIWEQEQFISWFKNSIFSVVLSLLHYF